MRQLLSDLGYNQSAPTILHSDNQAAIWLVCNPEFHKHTQHVDASITSSASIFKMISSQLFMYPQPTTLQTCLPSHFPMTNSSNFSAFSASRQSHVAPIDFLYSPVSLLRVGVLWYSTSALYTYSNVPPQHFIHNRLTEALASHHDSWTCSTSIFRR